MRRPKAESPGESADADGGEVDDDEVDDALRVLLDQLALRCDGLEAHAAKVDVLAQTQNDFRTTSEAVTAIGRRLDELSARLAPLEKLPARLESLEGIARSAPAPATDELAAMTAGVRALQGRMSSLEEASKKVEALAQDRGRLAALDKVLAGLVQGREQLMVRIEALEAAPAPPVAAPGPVFDPAKVKMLADRVAKLESASPVEPRIPAGLAKQMERLVSQSARTTPRLEALDAVVADLVQSLGQLSSKLAGLDEVPKRVEELEQASSPSEKVVASLAKRVDRLSTAAASVKELPQRVEALERATAEMPDESSDRGDALAVGLGHAIDMVDQLAHQVAVLESRSQA